MRSPFFCYLEGLEKLMQPTLILYQISVAGFGIIAQNRYNSLQFQCMHQELDSTQVSIRNCLDWL